VTEATRGDRLWSPPARSATAEARHAAMEQRMVDDPETFSLDPEVLAADATAATGLTDFGATDYLHRLRVYLDAHVEEARLHALGRRTARMWTSGALRARLRHVAFLAEHREVGDRLVRRPMFVIGGWRSGTTLLQRLLAQDPARRAARNWELRAPTAAASGDPDIRARALHAAEEGSEGYRRANPTLHAMHPTGAEEPEECSVAMASELLNWATNSWVRVPSYAEWLGAQDLGPAYAAHRQRLQMLQGRFDDSDDDREWVLKGPAHTPALSSLFEAFPDALVIQMHRDVVDTVTSACLLFAEFRSILSDDIDPIELGQWQTACLDDWFARAHRARSERPTGSEARVADVSYAELVRDPMPAIARLYDEFDLELTSLASEAMQRHLADNPKHKHGTYQYAPEQFGLDPGELRERFAWYVDLYGLDGRNHERH
jgi:Sulfotransferase family